VTDRAAGGDDGRPRHTLLDDVQGVAAGVLMAALSLLFLRGAGLVTGQAAGVALLLSYATGWDLGLVLFAINLPFLALGAWRIGWRFALKSVLAMAALMAAVSLGAPFVTVAPTHPLAAAVLGGVMAGFALLAVFRHGASLGGLGVVAVWLQDATGFRAGWTQMIVDAAVFGVAFLVLDPAAVATSAVGAAILNLMIALNHRRDRYVAI
jgi:uncharacterized membrane-anchored protein YitT (DUF2179 family)